MDSDSLDGASVVSAGPSPNSDSQIGDGEGTSCNTVSDLNNVSSVGTANENAIRLFSKIKSKVGLNKSKEKKVIKQKQTSVSSECNNSNEKQISTNNGNNISISKEKQISVNNGNSISLSNDENLTCDSDITHDSSG